MLAIIKSLFIYLYNWKPIKGSTQIHILRCCRQVCTIIVIAAFVFFARLAESATYKLPDCSQTTVQSFINSASDRDVLVCPAGSWTWTTTTSNSPSVTVNKAITLVGAGFDIVSSTTTTVTTNIIDGTANNWNGNEVALSITGVAGKLTRISGFSFAGSSDGYGVIRVSSPSNSPFWKLFRLDHCNSGMNGTVISFWSAYGVVDHCTFAIPYPNNTIRIHGTPNGVKSSFSKSNPAGTDDAVYVEDCTFNSPGPTYGAGDLDCDQGGHFVVRYSTFNNAGIQLHDTAYTGLRGCRHWEIYNNTFTATVPNIAWHFAGRAGTGVIHDNVTMGNYTYAYELTNYRSSDTSHGESLAIWGWCDGTYSCDGNDVSYPPASNGSVASGYPCMDQIGRITDVNANGYTCYGNTGNPGAGQLLEPVYAWNNKFNSSSYNSVIYVPSSQCKTNAIGVSICVSDHIKSGRDFYDNVMAKPGYKAYRYPHPLADPTVPKLGSQ